MKKRKKIEKKYYIYIIFSLPILLLVLKNLFYNGHNRDIFLLNKPKDYTVEIDSKAIVVKDEFLYYIGNADIELKESKIPANLKLLDLNLENENSKLKSYLELSTKSIEEDLSKLKDKKRPRFNFSDFSKMIRDRNFKEAIDFVNVNKVSLFSKDVLNDKIFRNNILKETFEKSSVTSKTSGYFSKNIDGLEDLYNFKIIDLVDERDFNFTSNIEDTKISGIKIVNNLKYYLCILVDKDSFTDEKTLEVNIDGQSATGFIRSKKSSDKKDLLVVEFSTLFEKIKDKRFLNLKIVKSFKNSYELPKSSISVDDRGNNYIYILDLSGALKRIKVNVLYKEKDQENVYVDSKDLYLNPFANIIKNASNLKGITDEK